MLPPNDTKYLENRISKHSICGESNMTCIVFHDFPIPLGFDHSTSDLLIRLSSGYPDVPPDMWWFDPPISRIDGAVVPATEVRESHIGRSWQRWSRHFAAGQWRSGIDGIESFLALVRRELERSAPTTVS